MGGITNRSFIIQHTRSRLANRATMERMAEYSSHLEPRDQQLLDAYFESKITLNELARLHGKTRQSMRRWINRLMRRMSDPMFRVVLHLGPALPGDLGELAHAHYVRGRSRAQLARDLDIPEHHVRWRLQQARNGLVALSLRETGWPELAGMLA